MHPPLEIVRPVFITGTVRSGSTFLSQCLNSHPGLDWVYEASTGTELCAEWANLGGVHIGAPVAGYSDCPAMSSEQATPEVCQRIREGFAAVWGRQGGNTSKRFLHKNPHFCNKLPFLRGVFPDTRLIITSRDVRSCVLSVQMLWMKVQKVNGVSHFLPEDETACWGCSPPVPRESIDPARLFPGGSIRVLGEYWLRMHECLEAGLEGFDHAMMVRHRDLIANPQEQLRRVFVALDLDPDERMDLPEVDPTRNQRWPHLLARREREELESFIEINRSRIERLTWADTTL